MILELIGLDAQTTMLMDGNTTLARLGVTVHQSSMYLPPGQDPHIVTLEIFNAGIWDVQLKFGMRVGKLLAFRSKGPNSVEARSFNQYNGQKETTGAVFKR